ncbi:MAG: chromosomal replication initiator protein DnaA, partial [Deltaproteobacteria bacterium]
MSTIWEDVKKQIKPAIPEKSYLLWINSMIFLENKDDTLVLGCPNKFSRNWIMDNYMGIMEEKLDKIGNGNFKLTLKVQAPEKRRAFSQGSNGSKQLTLPNMPTKRRIGRSWLNKEFTFDRFVVGHCNEFAYSASRALALGHNQPYNPLFMLASTGLGKSHLSQAIGHAILDHDPGVRVCYITAEDFVNEMIFALRNGRIDEFKNKYRRCCDVLLLEEVHFLGGKGKIQIELGYTLDALANEHKKLIFTSPLLPKDIPNLTKELSSRLTSGVITTLDRPDYKTAVKILQKKSAEHNLTLSEQIVHLFAEHLTKDIRQIESALRCLKANFELMKAEINLDLAKEVLKCHVSEQEFTTMEDIERLVCRYFKIDTALLRSKSRKKIHSYPRSIYVYLCRHYTDATLEDIGKSIQRNHSTVLYASEV